MEHSKLADTLNLFFFGFGQGSCVSLNATTAPLMRQLGIYDEFVAMSKIIPSIQVGNENRDVEFAMTAYFEEATER